jgi:hypothetical protein
MKRHEIHWDRMQRCAVLLLGAASLACAPVPRPGDEVQIGEESAIIIWDPAAKTQHFIRRASFRTKAKDFGFLVPTPTIPKLEEADDDAFRLLGKITAPEVVHRSVARGTPVPKTASRVTVITTANVAGYDATILEATDAEALNRWLGEHGYASSPELVEWFKPYLEQKWKISAFKIAGDDKEGAVSTKAVRMSFQTDKPFFPYREPVAQSRSRDDFNSRLLRVYFLAEARYGGAIGVDTEWPSRTVWSNRIDKEGRAELLRLAKLPADSVPNARWLTEFLDHSSPRSNADEVYFSVANNQDKVQRPDELRYTYYDRNDHDGNEYWVIGIGIVAGVFLFVFFLSRRLWRKA